MDRVIGGWNMSVRRLDRVAKTPVGESTKSMQLICRNGDFSNSLFKRIGTVLIHAEYWSKDTLQEGIASVGGTQHTNGRDGTWQCRIVLDLS